MMTMIVIDCLRMQLFDKKIVVVSYHKVELEDL